MDEQWGLRILQESLRLYYAANHLHDIHKLYSPFQLIEDHALIWIFWIGESGNHPKCPAYNFGYVNADGKEENELINRMKMFYDQELEVTRRCAKRELEKYMDNLKKNFSEEGYNFIRKRILYMCDAYKDPSTMKPIAQWMKENGLTITDRNNLYKGTEYRYEKI
jgi:hypothetical protein